MNTLIDYSPNLLLDVNPVHASPPIHAHGEYQRRMVRGPVELHAALDRVLRCFSAKGRNVFVTRMCEGDLQVNVSQAILSRVLYCLLECVFNAEQWRNTPPTSVILCTQRRPGSSGALLELADNGGPLPRRLMAELSDPEPPSPHFLPGWQLLKCRELAEKNGGRLITTSPLNGKTFGLQVRLFLPLVSNKTF